MKLCALKWASLLGVPLAPCDWKLFNFGRFASCNWRGRIRGLVSIFHVKDARSSRRTKTWVACASPAVWLTTRHCVHSPLWHGLSSALPFDSAEPKVGDSDCDARALLADRKTAGMRVQHR
jgi:hypothetical protein